MVVDLGREHSRLVDGLLRRHRVIAVPSAPKTGPYQDGEWNDGGNHQGQKARLNAPQQHRLPLCPAAVLCRSNGSPQLPSETLFRESCEGGEKPDLFDYNE
jgi:hypothetical protein